MRRVVAFLTRAIRGRSFDRRDIHEQVPSERGDTLVEVLLALAILGIAGLALLTAFATSITASGEHRNLASLDSSERTAANTAIADIQQEARQFAGQANDPFSCPDTFAPTFSNLAATFQVTYTMGWWNGSTFVTGPSNCISDAPQQYVLTLSSSSNNNYSSAAVCSASSKCQVTTVVSDPAAPEPPNGVGAAYQLQWVQQPTGGSAYSPVTPQPEVAVEDSQGDIVSSDFSSVTLQKVSGPGTVSNTCSGVESYGIVQFSDCSMSTAGTYQIQAVDANSAVHPTPISATFTVTAATPAKIAFTSTPVSGTASNSATLGPITVQQQDAFGDPVPTTTPITVNLSSSSAGAGFASTSGGGAITSVTIPAGSSSAPAFYYGDTNAGSPTITATAAGLVSGTQTETINAGSASKLVITSGPFTAASGSKATTPFTVTLEDKYGNATTASTSTKVNLTSNSSGTYIFNTTQGATTPTGATNVNIPSGSSSVTVYYGDSAVGTPTITASSTSLTSATQKETVTGGPTKLVLTGPTSGPASAGAAIGPFTVTEEAANGTPTTVGETVNLTSSSAGTYIFSTTQGSTTPTGATSVTIPGGQSSVTFYYGDTKAGTPTITAAATGLTSATQLETISAAPATQLIFTSGTKSGAASNSATLGPISVQEQDSYGNVTTTGLTVNLSSSSAGTNEFAATSGGTTITSVNIAAGNSTATFYYGDERAGSPTITAAAAGLTSATQQETITAGAGTQLAITSTAFTAAANSQATNAFEVTLEDGYGNATTKTTATTINLSSNSTGTHEFATTSGGTAVFSVTLPANTSSVGAYYGDEKPGTPTITAAATGLISATQQESITAGAPSKLTFTTGPVSGPASNTATLGPITVEELDAYGNVATTGTPTTVNLTSTSAGATFAATSGGVAVTEVTIPGGSSTATFYYGDTKAGTPTITAAATGLTSATQQETITALAGTQLSVSAFSGPASSSATNAFTVTLEDLYGNAVTTANPISVNLSSNSTGTYEFAATFKGAPGLSVTIPANASSVTAYYGDTKAGTPAITAKAAGLLTGFQQETITAATTNDTMTIVQGNIQSTTVATPFGTSLEVNVVDQYNNPVSGMSVTFTAPASGASGTFTTCSGGNNGAFTTCSVATNTAGNATASTFTANHIAGLMSVTTSASGVATPPTFSLTNTAGTASTIGVFSGAPQSATVNTSFTNPLVAVVTDTYGNPVSGATVTFTAPAATGASGTFLATTNGGTCLASGGTAVASCTATTNGIGQASSLTFKADTTAGTYVVGATSPGTTPNPSIFSETNKAGTATTIAVSSGAAQSAKVNTSFTNPLVAVVTDTYGNPVSGATVTFTAPAATGASGTFLATTNGGTCLASGGTAVASCTATTNASGLASSLTFKADTHAGTYNVGATSPGTTPNPLNFSETNTAATTNDTMTIVQGNIQSTTVATPFGTSLEVNVVDQYNNPVSGMTVTFTAPASGASGTFGACSGGNNGTFTTCSVATNAAGNATASTFTANHIAGAITVTPSASGVATPPTFSETNTAGAATTIGVSSGAPQSATVNTSFTNPLVAVVTDTYGNPVSGATVTFTAPAATGASGTFLATTNGGTCLASGGTAVASCTATTNASGLASSLTFKADTHAGTYNVGATSPGTTPNPLNFSETNTAATTNDTMTIVQGNIQSTTVATPFGTSLEVNVVDQYNNPVSGMTVTFTAPASGASGTFGACSGGNNGTFTTCSVATNAAGNATASTFTANHIAGAITVTPSASGVATPPTFSETNTAGAATTIGVSSGAPQSATVNTSFTNPLVAVVTDTYGNPVSGATVTFTAPAATGASGTFLATTNGGTCLASGGTAVASCTATTNASGLASSLTFKADTHAGTYNVGATSPGTTPNPLNFSETNTAATTNDTMTIVQGNIQSTTVATPFGTSLEVNVVDQYNNPVSGMTVTFTAPASGASGTFGACSGGNNGTFTTCSVATNAAGNATASTFTANHIAGAITVTPSASGVATPPTFSETNTAGAATTIGVSSGAPQSATVNTSFTNPLVAVVTDTYGNPVSGATVTFTAPAATGASGTFLATTNGGTCLASGGTAVASCTATTNASGLASSLTFKADTHAGTYNVGATSPGTTPNPLNFSETNTAGAATTIGVSSGAPQSATVNTSFTNPLVAVVTDTYGNPVSGATVTFTAPAATGASGTFLATTNGGTCLASGGTAVASCTATTNASGLASSLTFKADTHAGTYNVGAISPGTTPNPLNFSETNTVPPTVTSVASGTGTTSATSSGFSMTSGTTYLVAVFERASATAPIPTLTINGAPATTLIASNNFGGTTSPNCNSNRCYVDAWSFNANTTSGAATVGVSGTNAQNFVVDVLALAGNNTTTPIVQSNGTESAQAGTVSANLTSPPAAGDVSVEIIGSDDTIGTALTWSAGSSNLFNSSNTNASLGTYMTTPAAQTDTTSSSGFGNAKDWATIALEIAHA